MGNLNPHPAQKHGRSAAIVIMLSVAAITPLSFSGPLSVQQVARAGNIAMKVDLKDLAKSQNPVLGYYDPLGLADAEFWEQSNEATVGFLRHAEMKHGRVAMAGFVGYCVHENGIRWPWALSTSLPDYSSFEGLSAPDVWDAIPEVAKYQIIAVIGYLEVYSENSAVLGRQGQAHYMRPGGKPGFFPSFQGQTLKELGYTNE